MAAYTRALTIAGSDSGGGAGIQADLKTFSALRCYGLSVITAITAQNTREVTAVHPIPTADVAAQLDAVLSDIGVDAIKIGMLHNAETTAAVAKALSTNQAPVVLDPVMVAKSGDRLLSESAIDSLRQHMFPLSDLITPNLPEAAALLDRKVRGRDDMEAAAADLMALGPKAVLLKGGHLEAAQVSDILIHRLESGGVVTRWFDYPRVDTPNTHGTGCTLSSAIAAYLARGFTMEDSVSAARDYVQRAIQAGAAYQLGHGHGPVHHFHAVWQE
jgi:hydroxymethylpyrimidine/phosphomethylpyrimidine kinase